MHVALLGFGLIGGSLARALRERDPGGWTIAAWTPGGSGPARALDDRVLDRAAATLESALEDAELVVLAAPPLACLELLDQLARLALPAGAVVTDVASTKRRICRRAERLGLPFVGGHPMAGRESTGYAAADANLFVERPWVVCADDPEARDAERVEALVLATGARPVRLDPTEHDRAVAAISHLPLVLSAALVEAVSAADGWPLARSLAASGWRDMTRLARGDVEMGAGILATNADEVAVRLRAARDGIDGWLAALAASSSEQDAAHGIDPEPLRERLARARSVLDGPADGPPDGPPERP